MDFLCSQRIDRKLGPINSPNLLIILIIIGMLLPCLILNLFFFFLHYLLLLIDLVNSGRILTDRRNSYFVGLVKILIHITVDGSISQNSFWREK